MNEQLNTDTDNTDTDKGKPLIHFVEKDDLNKPSAITLCGRTITRPPIPKSKMKEPWLKTIWRWFIYVKAESRAPMICWLKLEHSQIS